MKRLFGENISGLVWNLKEGQFKYKNIFRIHFLFNNKFILLKLYCFKYLYSK
jgi:hypothetical protein